MTDHIKVMERMRRKHPGARCETCKHSSRYAPYDGRWLNCFHLDLIVGSSYVCSAWKALQKEATVGNE